MRAAGIWSGVRIGIGLGFGALLWAWAGVGPPRPTWLSAVPPGVAAKRLRPR